MRKMKDKTEEILTENKLAGRFIELENTYGKCRRNKYIKLRSKKKINKKIGER
jgi:hypothetical protein